MLSKCVKKAKFWFTWRAKNVLSTHRRTGNFLPGGAVNHLPKKILASWPNSYETYSQKETRAIRCSNIGRTDI